MKEIETTQTPGRRPDSLAAGQRYTLERKRQLEERAQSRYDLATRVTPPESDFVKLLRQGERGTLRAATREGRAYDVLQRFDVPIEKGGYLVYEDGDLLVVSKPPYLFTHSNPGFDFKIGMEEIARRKRGKDVVHAHRLDAETSGILVFGKNTPALMDLMDQFEHKEGSGMEKVYAALLEGEFASGEEQRIAVRLASLDDRRRVEVVHDPKARRGVDSLTYVRPLRVFHDSADHAVTLARIEIKTGRTHQIRAVTAGVLGTPLVGDKIYNEDPHVDAPRQMLHAINLGLTHPTTGRQRNFQAPPPADFNKVVSGLREIRRF